MVNNENFETPELGDYSKEEFVMRAESNELKEARILTNNLETEGLVSNPIEALKHFVAEAKKLILPN